MDHLVLVKHSSRKLLPTQPQPHSFVLWVPNWFKNILETVLRYFSFFFSLFFLSSICVSLLLFSSFVNFSALQKNSHLLLYSLTKLMLSVQRGNAKTSVRRVDCSYAKYSDTIQLLVENVKFNVLCSNCWINSMVSTLVVMLRCWWLPTESKLLIPLLFGQDVSIVRLNSLFLTSKPRETSSRSILVIILALDSFLR